MIRFLEIQNGHAIVHLDEKQKETLMKILQTQMEKVCNEAKKQRSYSRSLCLLSMLFVCIGVSAVSLYIATYSNMKRQCNYYVSIYNLIQLPVGCKVIIIH